ncbi:shikimate dehydrogenase [Blattabacterium sp. (Blaberus giganteus)]|uniref:shikimate dehydrogenase family protein n=1 Tax=Blattabacterium sp. (Blaberus giganteus) TaxID=1186051 RepID=UPI00025F6FEC|nr:shikimate dehydrogenase [Blattabacterium sp. (Blaberus giganteus)]AFJ90914.1 shikimate dehydrogenase [Blattabacterium sp. (Blaberus giganteus)]
MNEKIKIYGLIGKDIKYSFSQKFFLEKFQKESIVNTNYEIFDIPKIENVLYVFKTPYLEGCNVTIPYKTSIIPFLTKIVPEAKSIGSVNVIKIYNQCKTGFNTDVLGFESSFKKDLNNQFIKKNKKNLQALILGTGGVSKTISFVLEKLQISYKYVSRNKKKNKNFLVYEDLNQNLLEEHKIIINCTPVGTYPNVDLCPNIPYQYISSEHYFYDLVYNPNKTLFLKKAEKKGALIKNGLEMLYLQAEESWNIWKNRKYK